MRALSTLIWACGLSLGHTPQRDRGDTSPQTCRQLIEVLGHNFIEPVTKCVLDDRANPATPQQWNTTEADISQNLREVLLEGLLVGLDLPVISATHSSRAQSWMSFFSGKEGPRAAVPNKPGPRSEHHDNEDAALPLRIMASVSAITALAIWSMSQGSVSGLKACTLLVCLLFLQQRQVVGW